MDINTKTASDWFAQARQYEQNGKLREADLCLRKAVEREAEERASQ